MTCVSWRTAGTVTSRGEWQDQPAFLKTDSEWHQTESAAEADGGQTAVEMLIVFARSVIPKRQNELEEKHNWGGRARRLHSQASVIRSSRTDNKAVLL